VADYTDAGPCVAAWDKIRLLVADDGVAGVRACSVAPGPTSVAPPRRRSGGAASDGEQQGTCKQSADAPASKQFTIVNATGSKLIQNRVFHRLLESEEQAGDSSNRKHTELGPDNYTFSLAGTEGTNYVLNVEPKEESRFLYRGKIWVDAHDFAVTRIEAQPARNPSFWTTKSVIHHTYQKVDNGFYLPKENKTVTSVRLGGVATLTIDYQSYQVTAAKPVASARRISSSEGAVWPDGGFNAEVANFVSSRK
jgi:hypothetical protein